MFYDENFLTFIFYFSEKIFIKTNFFVILYFVWHYRGRTQILYEGPIFFILLWKRIALLLPFLKINEISDSTSTLEFLLKFYQLTEVRSISRAQIGCLDSFSSLRRIIFHIMQQWSAKSVQVYLIVAKQLIRKQRIRLQRDESKTWPQSRSKLSPVSPWKWTACEFSFNVFDIQQFLF